MGFARGNLCRVEIKANALYLIQRRPAMNDIVLLNLRISMWGVSRVLPDHEYDVDADKAMVRATKKILECPEYEFLLQLKWQIHRRLKTLALPGEILRAGVYPISVGMVEAVEKTLEDFSVRWGVGVLGLEQVWDLRVREVEDRLRALYDEDDLPILGASPRRVRCALELLQHEHTAGIAGRLRQTVRARAGQGDGAV